jgi:hypothetical protein
VSDPQTFNIRVGAVRQRAALRPKSQIWFRSALDWVMDLGSVKQLTRQPTP